MTAGKDGTARIWDAASGKRLMVLSHDGGPIYSAAFIDGREVVTASEDGAVGIWGRCKRQAANPF